MFDFNLKKTVTIILFMVFSGIVLHAQIKRKSINYDETKVGDYKLPELLRTKGGLTIKDVKIWEKFRRPEILSLFEEHVYGKVPTDFDKIDFAIKKDDFQAMDGLAHLKEVKVMIHRGGKSLLINLTLFIPKRKKKPVPAFLLINNRSKRNASPTRDTISEFWPAEEMINAGYAIASFQVSEAAPDDKVRYKDGVLRLYPELHNKNDGMRTIGSWAWAASRIMDYFEIDDEIDHKRVALVGHSRGGKTALWAAATDKRFALCISNNSGNTGAALSRRNFGETVEVINTAFPHWFNANYKKYNNNEKKLPIDQHMLVALIAPRPVYITSASKDLWADPVGMFLAAKEAEQVYQLYRLQSALPNTHPAIDNPIYKSVLAYHMRNGKHNLTKYDWKQFIKFANFHFFDN